jgi:quinol monooxygenase YgiN
MSVPTGPSSLFAEFTALPGRRADVAALISAFGTRVRAEPGTLLFEVNTRRERPDAFVVFEVYRDPSAFDAHLHADYSRSFNEQLAPLIVEEGSRLTWLEAV